MSSEDARAAWSDVCQRWLDVSFSAIAAHALEVADGDQGVLMVEVDTEKMNRLLALAAKPNASVPVRLDPIWLPAGEFLKIIREHATDGEGSAERWGKVLEAMDPRRDVALYLHTPKNSARYFSRFLFTSPPVGQ